MLDVKDMQAIKNQNKAFYLDSEEIPNLLQVGGSMGLWLGLGVVQVLQLVVTTLGNARKICKKTNSNGSSF